MRLEKVILIPKLIVALPPVVALNYSDIPASTHTEHVIHIFAAADIAAPERQHKLVRISTLIFVKYLARVVGRAVVVHYHLKPEVDLLHKYAVKQLGKIARHVVRYYGNADINRSFVVLKFIPLQGVLFSPYLHGLLFLAHELEPRLLIETIRAHIVRKHVEVNTIQAQLVKRLAKQLFCRVHGRTAPMGARSHAYRIFGCAFLHIYVLEAYRPEILVVIIDDGIVSAVGTRSGRTNIFAAFFLRHFLRIKSEKSVCARVMHPFEHKRGVLLLKSAQRKMCICAHSVPSSNRLSVSITYSISLSGIPTYIGRLISHAAYFSAIGSAPRSMPRRP